LQFYGKSASNTLQIAITGHHDRKLRHDRGLKNIGEILKMHKVTSE